MIRVALIGNAAGGKSTLAKALAARLGLPLYHVDQVQFGPDWSPVFESVVAAELDAAADGPRWIIDGWGPWPTIERRFERADTIVWIDLPLWVHFWWAAERQIAVSHEGGAGLEGQPEGDARGLTRRLFETIWAVDQVKPRLAALVDRFVGRSDVHHLTSPEALGAFAAAYARRHG
jgi:hypothetical protein